MTTEHLHAATANGGIPPDFSGGGQEVYEQLVALLDKMGSAYVDACQQIGRAYVDAYQEIGAPAGELDEKGPAPRGTRASRNAAIGKHLERAQDRIREINDTLTDMTVKVGLAYLDAYEQAVHAAADCEQQLGATSGVSSFEAVTAARAGLAREVATAGVGTIRAIIPGA
jgi:hypothetical protein